MFEERNRRIWKEIKPQGLKSYMFRWGIMKMGLVLFVAVGFISPLVNHGFSQSYFQSDGFINRLIVSAITSILGGLYLAYSSWRELEKKYD